VTVPITVFREVGKLELRSSPLAKTLKDDEPHYGGYEGDFEVLQSKDIREGMGPSLSASIDNGEFAHQQVGVEEKNDERYLYTRS
jgi:hypothetical protein